MKTAEPDGERLVPAGWRTIPRGIWALGFVSLFMDTSSELIHSLLPVFLVSVIGPAPYRSVSSRGWPRPISI